MGQHKHNPTAIAAKKGELPPKQREKQLTKREAEVLLRRKNPRSDAGGICSSGGNERNTCKWRNTICLDL